MKVGMNVLPPQSMIAMGCSSAYQLNVKLQSPLGERRLDRQMLLGIPFSDPSKELGTDAELDYANDSHRARGASTPT